MIEVSVYDGYLVGFKNVTRRYIADENKCRRAFSGQRHRLGNLVVEARVRSTVEQYGAWDG
jgi:hypothetical protein